MVDRIVRVVLIGLHLFLGATAVFGAVWVVPVLPPEWLAGTPFRDYTIPALALGVVVGGGALVAAALLVFRYEWGILLSLMVGLAIAIFEVVETTVMGLDVWLHALGLAPAPTGSPLPLDGADLPLLLGVPAPLWLQPFYFALGLVIIALALRLRAHQAREVPRAHPLGG